MSMIAQYARLRTAELSELRRLLIEAPGDVHEFAGDLAEQDVDEESPTPRWNTWRTPTPSWSPSFTPRPQSATASWSGWPEQGARSSARAGVDRTAVAVLRGGNLVR
jgi:hypothetical protein